MKKKLFITLLAIIVSFAIGYFVGLEIKKYNTPDVTISPFNYQG
jgi:hypothetical protein